MMQIGLQRNKDGSVETEVKIEAKVVKSTYDKILEEAAGKAEIEGFRKGKAPVELVEKKLGKTKLYQQVLERLLPEVVAKAIKEHELKPITAPKLKPVSLKEDADWELKLQVVEMPSFDLGEYKDHVRGALQATKIWVPGDDKQGEKGETSGLKEQKGKEVDESLSDKRLKKVFDALLDNIKVPLAEQLVIDETNRALSKLLNQVQKLGMTIDQYASSLNKSTKALREEYEVTAKNNLKLEFILQKIAEDMKIGVENEEIEAMIKAIPDEKTRQIYEKSASQKAYVASVLKKRKVVDALLKLG